MKSDNNSNNNNNNNNQNNDNDNIFTVTVTNSRRKRRVRGEIPCVRYWICKNSQLIRPSNLDRFVQFSLVFTLAKIWEIDVDNCEDSYCQLDF